MNRVLAIIQLCFAFTLMLWVLAKPFTSDYFTTRSELLLFQTAIGEGNAFIPSDKLQRHADRFAKMDTKRQQRIFEAYQRLEQKIQTPFFVKLAQSSRGLLLDLPPFTQAWLLFSVVIAILLLRGSEGAQQAAWLLPVITLCCAVDNIHRPVSPPSIDETLLPSEQLLLRSHSRCDGFPWGQSEGADSASRDASIVKPIDKERAPRFGCQGNQAQGDWLLGSQDSESWGQYRAVLTQAWQRYLIEVWAGQIPSVDSETFALQVESGEHALTMARIEKRLSILPAGTHHSEQTPWLLILFYLIWNSGFAVLVNNSPYAPRAPFRLSQSPGIEVVKKGTIFP